MKRILWFCLLSSFLHGQDISKDTVSDKPLVLTTVYPIHWVTETLLGEQASVLNLTQHADNPRKWTPDDSAKALIRQASLVILQGGGYESWKPENVEKRLLNSSEKISTTYADQRNLSRKALENFYLETEGITWFDPLHLSLQAEIIANEVKKLPDMNLGLIDENLKKIQKELTTLTLDLHAEHRLHTTFGGGMHPALAWTLGPGYKWKVRTLPESFLSTLHTENPDWKTFREFYEFYPVDYLIFLNELPPAEVQKELNTSLMITIKVLDSLEKPDEKNTGYPERMRKNFETLTRGFTK
jgi:ABC-type Zn uptake system ZnuABC Zn-binding protein ZnuA